MQILNLIKKESHTSFNSLIGMAVFSGIANAMLLAIINSLIGEERPEEIGFQEAALFAITVVLFYFSKKDILRRSTVIVEKVVSQLRLRIADKIRKAELAVIERMGSANIYARITQDANYISQSAAYLINAFQAAMMISASIMYLLYLSAPAFFIVVAAILLGFVHYMKKQKLIRDDIRKMFAKETEFFESLNEVLAGIKELKLHHRKNERLYDEYSKLARETEEIKIRTGFHYVHNMTFSQLFFYVLIGLTAFVLPKISADGGGPSAQIVTALLFIIGPMESLVGSVQLYTKANTAAQNIEKLESELEQGAAIPYPSEPELIKPQTFERSLNIQRLAFVYPVDEGHESFKLGPLDLEIRKGETLFIVGGNGSGKSTLLKLIAGLYLPSEGSITVDDHIIGENSYPQYRELFSTIFTDFHLFKALYGIEMRSPERFAELLRIFELHDKTSFVNGRFTNLNLSTGQRKRLAIIAAIMEDKPTFIFDEVAADQDPEFRKYFYERILVELKEQSKTIIAASHDDNYFHAADRIVRMEYGSIVDIQENRML